MSITDEFFENFKDEELLKLKKKEITPVIDEVKTFFVKENIVIYGGTAMNMYLPKRLQFYNKYDIPDYDGYHVDAKNQSIGLINLLKKQRYEFLMVKHAIHDGTYKVSWIFKDIADITHVNKFDYDRIVDTAFRDKHSGLLLVNINLLKSSAYIELGMPKSSSFRWGKVYKRVSLLESTHKLKSNVVVESLFNDTVPDTLNDLINNIYSYVRENKLPLVGFDAVKHYLNINTRNKHNIDFYNNSFALIEILSDDIYGTVSNVTQLLGKIKVLDEKSGKQTHIEYDKVVYKKSELVPASVEFVVYVARKKYRVLKVYDVSKKCVSVISDNSKKGGGVLYGSIFFLLYVYYYILFASSNQSVNTIYKAVINRLLAVIDTSKFTMQCYGFNKSVSVIRKSRALKNFKGVVAKS